MYLPAETFLAAQRVLILLFEVPTSESGRYADSSLFGILARVLDPALARGAGSKAVDGEVSLVLGAGIAGLSTVLHLLEYSTTQEIHILDCRSRIAGRVHGWISPGLSNSDKGVNQKLLSPAALLLDEGAAWLRE